MTVLFSILTSIPRIPFQNHEMTSESIAQTCVTLYTSAPNSPTGNKLLSVGEFPETAWLSAYRNWPYRPVMQNAQ